jgi:hypothetical protein
MREMKRQEAGGNCRPKSFVMCRVHQTLSGDQTRKDEMGDACGTHRGEIKKMFREPERKIGW